MKPWIAIVLVFVGCCSNVVFLELIVKEEPGSGNIVTFAQFLLIAIEGFIITTRCGRKSPAIPLSSYLVLVALFYIVSVTNNQALGYNISMPLHMIFRAGSLMANLILGIIILKRKYAFSKYMAVLMISIGIGTATIASAGGLQSDSENSETGKEFDFVHWMKGIGLLTFALFMSARMGIYQETIYSKHGKHPKEALFYNHALPLPGFLLLAQDIYSHAMIFNKSAPMVLPVIGSSIPKLWLYLLGNILTQYVCISSVFVLTTECTSLTVTLVVTLRKFVSLLFSILYFKNPFTFYHWMGTVLVFGGTLIFTETPQRIMRSMQSSEQPKKVKAQ